MLERGWAINYFWEDFPLKFIEFMKLRSAAIVVVVATVAALSIYYICDRSQLTIEGRIVGAKGTTLYLDCFATAKGCTLDSVALSPNGSYCFKVAETPVDPTYYELRCGWDRIPILASRGEDIEINTIGSMSLNYTVEGSTESELLREFYQPYMRGAGELSEITSRYAKKSRDGIDVTDITKIYNAKYKEIKQQQIKFIIANKDEMAALYALMQHLPGDEHLVSESSDLIYKRTIAESLAASYPNSEYVNMLLKSIREKENLLELMTNAKLLGYPEITMNDMYGKKISLSSLEGSVVVVDFWAPKMGLSNQNNLALKKLYSKYKESGLEVFQVGVSNLRTEWIDAVQMQKLPWISVSDLRGEASSVLRLYNVKSIPSNVLISKSGDIVARNLFGAELDAAVLQELNKAAETK